MADSSDEARRFAVLPCSIPSPFMQKGVQAMTLSARPDTINLDQVLGPFPILPGIETVPAEPSAWPALN